MKIKTKHVNGNGWSAVVETDRDGPTGTGASEWAAVEDLIRQLEHAHVPQAELNSALWDWFRDKHQRDGEQGPA
jgi:hypothetical protein